LDLGGIWLAPGDDFVRLDVRHLAAADAGKQQRVAAVITADGFARLVCLGAVVVRGAAFGIRRVRSSLVVPTD
jgi:hypothetical protein